MNTGIIAEMFRIDQMIGKALRHASRLLNSSLQVGGASGLAIVTAAITPATDLAMLYPGMILILVFAVLALVAQLIRWRG